MKKYIFPAGIIMAGVVLFLAFLYIAERLTYRPDPPPTPRATEIPAPARWTPSVEDWGKG